MTTHAEFVLSDKLHRMACRRRTIDRATQAQQRGVDGSGACRCADSSGSNVRHGRQHASELASREKV